MQLIVQVLGDGLMSPCHTVVSHWRVKADGITFKKVACLAYGAGAKVEAFHTSQSNIDDFRSHVKKCAASEDCHLIASYHQKPFKQVFSLTIHLISL